MTEWVNYDANGKRVPSDSKRAVFRAKEVSVDIDVPAPPGHASLAGVEFRDVHAIDQPDLRKTFKSFSKMRALFKEHAAGAKGTRVGLTTSRGEAWLIRLHGQKNGLALPGNPFVCSRDWILTPYLRSLSPG